ncbi:hypothetical protein [Sandaracinus amylolyticus]|uniref:Uncharacterized protein n=1 Tax=Sandaracinus amylolyticus TaxID=927083 RepID=A0A0F6W1I7_9BACT|nr:hypothetical protein [Sandaracinus amylolyticus]AKF04865.1 hypothetical protein DB32_002014 [Sandaracinus amylolyticus]
MSSPDTLFAALIALRDAEDPLARRHDVHWRAVDAWLRETWPAGGADADEARQETLLAIARNVRTMEASVPLQAAKWVSTIHRRKKVDGFRMRKRDPVQRGLDRGSESEDATPLLDRLEGDAGGDLDGNALERVLATIEDHVEAELQATEPNAASRHLKRMQARATLHRAVLEADFDAIAAALDAGEPLTRDRVYKWVERGRPWVLAGLDRWVRESGEGSTASDIAAAVRELVSARRADAGRPRPSRRRGEGS